MRKVPGENRVVSYSNRVCVRVCVRACVRARVCVRLRVCVCVCVRARAGVCNVSELHYIFLSIFIPLFVNASL